MENWSFEKFIEGDFPIYGSGGLIGYHNQKTSTAPNIVIGRSGSTGKLYYIEKDFWAHNTGIFISDKKNNFCKYLFYLLSIVDMEELSTKTAVPTLDRKKIQEYKLPYTTNIDEQQRIANFLDDKCACIDSVIEKTRASIDEYKKLKQAVITRAVTKGIRPNRTMKDSGIEWIGDIPADWNTCRLRFLCDILTGNQDTQDNKPNGEYPFYVRSPVVERCEKWTFDGAAILMSGDGAGAGRIFHYVDGKYGCHQRVYSLQNIKQINRRFLFYYLKELFYVSIETANSKSTVDSVRLSMLQNFPILITSKEEQQEIVNYLDEKTAQIDSVIAKKNQLVSELESLKKSLIFEYVTGKKELPT